MNVNLTAAAEALDRMMAAFYSRQLSRKVRTAYKAVEEDHNIQEEKARKRVIKNLPEIADEE